LKPKATSIFCNRFNINLIAYSTSLALADIQRIRNRQHQRAQKAINISPAEPVTALSFSTVFCRARVNFSPDVDSTGLYARLAKKRLKFEPRRSIRSNSFVQ